MNRLNILNCDICADPVDSDTDPDCFVDIDGRNADWAVFCRRCREYAETEMLAKMRAKHPEYAA